MAILFKKEFENLKVLLNLLKILQKFRPEDLYSQIKGTKNVTINSIRLYLNNHNKSNLNILNIFRRLNITNEKIIEYNIFKYFI